MDTSNPEFCNESVWYAPRNRSAEDIQIEIIEFYLYGLVTPPILLIGMTGNIFNLITLHSPILQTVPFMYIRALAIFDLIGLGFVASYCSRTYFFPITQYWLAFYRAHMEMAALNSFFAASLYTSVILTLERYVTVSRAASRHHTSTHPRFVAALNILGALLLAIVLHLPMALQWEVGTFDGNGRIYQIQSSKIAHCHDPYHPIPIVYSWYKKLREAIRMLGVLLLVVCNIVITRKLQITKQRRRCITLKGVTRRRQSPSLLNSFTEKRLTAIMMAITVIYVLANAPQAVIMVLNTDNYYRKHWFQIFRGCFNMVEVINHCLNFYVFCISSRDYSTAFLQRCRCVKDALDTLLCHSVDLLRSSTESASLSRLDPEPELAEVCNAANVEDAQLVEVTNDQDDGLVYL